jgi:hypothetical protein
VRPTLAPTAAPTAAPTLAPTARPTPAPTARPTLRPTSAPTAEATLVAVAATRAPAPAPIRAAATAAGTAATSAPGPVRAAEAPRAAPAASGMAEPQRAEPRAEASPAAVAYRPTAPGAGSSSLNDKLKAALPGGPGGGLKRYDLGRYQTDRVLDAYEAALAPPLEVLARTFGLIYTARTAFRADAVQYVYERTRVLGVEVCKAYTIVEHPLRAPATKADHVGLGAPAAGDQTGLMRTGPLGDLKPEISTQIVPCDAKGMIPVQPGSLKSPAPRHAEDFVPPAPAP